MSLVDIIIVGGGSAGCTLAARLSEDPSIRILLLEAGPNDNNPLNHIPAGYALLGHRYYWGYHSAPLQHANNRSVELPQGKILGGGSTVNAMVATRGCAGDYDRWAQDYNCTGWSFKDVLPYFKRSEGNANLTDEYHGTSGPLGIEHVPAFPLTTTFVEAMQQAGIPFNPDFNGRQMAGSGFYQCSVRSARRSSAANSYLKGARHRGTISVLTGVTVTRVLFEKDAAVGVEYIHGGRTITQRAEREIVIAAGAVGSPKLLMLSGIGAAGDLQKLGINVVHDLKGVGRNLHDHARVDLLYELNGPYSLDNYKTRWSAAKLGLQYLVSKSGYCASNLLEGGGFWWSDRSDKDPNIQFFFVPHSSKVPYRHGCSMNCYELRPRSRGSVSLQSADPFEQPLIDPNYFAEPSDLARTVAGLKLCQDIMAQPAIARFVRREFAPGPAIATTQQYVEYARSMVGTGYHMVGSCRMGMDEEAVVSPDLKVRGLRNLRVIDASVMPHIVSGNTNIPTIMIAEKGADLIRAAR